MRRKQPKKNPKQPGPKVSEKTAALLPAKISGIQVQKNNVNRFSLFVEDEFLVGVSDSVLTKHNLKKGVEITPFLLEDILRDEEQWAAREYMLRILGRRDHSKKELRTKALRKGFSGDYLDDIILELEEKRYVNDRTFALKYASDKYEFNNWGPYKVRAALFKKGIDKSTAETALYEVFGDEQIAETLEELVLKKKKRFQREPEVKRRQKVFAFLMRKGYDSDNISKHLDHLLKLIE